MKMVRSGLYRILYVSFLVALVSLICSATSYSVTVDEYENRSNGNGSGMIAPGYLNIDKQRAEAITEQVAPEKGLIEQVMDYINSKLRERVIENQTEKVTPTLKKKKAGEGTSSEDIDPAWGLGDANGDNRVDLVDFAIVRAAYNTSVGDAGYFEGADFDKDGTVGTLDYGIFMNTFGMTYSSTPTTVVTTTPPPDQAYTAPRPKRLVRSNTYGRDLSNPFKRFAKGKSDTIVPEEEEEESVFTQADKEAKLLAMAPDMGEEYALVVVPLEDSTPDEIAVATMLEDILTNPTEEQKEMLDVAKSIMDDVEGIEKDSENEELKKASEDFTKMVTNAILAQAIPDLLKEGDISNINGMFGELSIEKKTILFEYHASVGEYYKSVVKELAANIAVLQERNILSETLTKRELEKLSAKRIDEIVDRIKKVKEKTLTEEQILRIEAASREEYIIPAKRILEDNMTTLLNGFTKKLFGVLDGAGLVKEKTE